MNWTGIGTRGFLPQKTINRQVAFGKAMASQGRELWAGGALQSDVNFLAGALSFAPHSRINNGRQHVVRSVGMERFSRPRGSFPRLHLCEESDLKIAVDYYIENDILPESFFNKVDEITRALHARNFYQVMESVSVAKSELVVYTSLEDRWGNIKGGTRTAVNVARNEGIPNFNIRTDAGWAALVDYVECSGILPKGLLCKE